MQAITRDGVRLMNNEHYVSKASKMDDDELWCERLLDSYFADDDEHKHDAMTLEEFAAQEGVAL